MAIVAEGFLTMMDIVFLVCQVSWFDVFGEECCDAIDMILPVVSLFLLRSNNSMTQTLQ